MTKPYPKRKVILHTMDSLHANCVEVGDCWEWQGAYTLNGHPTGRHDGKPVLMRRLAYVLAGNTIKPKHIVAASCGNARCINPACTVQRSQRQHLIKMGKEGRQSDHLRNAKLAATKRAKYAKLTIEQVRAIRAANTSNLEEAIRYGVHPRNISRIRRYVCWKEYGQNPFAGLGARA